MKLYFKGHAHKYAVEQMMVTLFPGEKPEYPDAPPASQELAATCTLSTGLRYFTACVTLRRNGCSVRRQSRAPRPAQEDTLATARAQGRALKLAFYRAALDAGIPKPAWGALTGVRPVKIPTRAMEHGATPRQAARLLRDRYDVSPTRSDLALDCAEVSLVIKRSLQPNEVSLYIGIPFCPTRCSYCSFISADVRHALTLVEPFLAALLQEVAGCGELLQAGGLTVGSVYIGGGTPTTLSAAQLATLLEQVAIRFDLSHCIEYTVEAGRPDTITREKLAVLRRFGVTRISVNPQSMSDDVLSAIGRSHTAEDTRDAYAMVRKSGTFALNMDLIAGLPRDTIVGFRSSLDEVIALAPENITVHTLALKKGARLMTEGDFDPGNEEVAAMLDYGWQTLRSAGYRPYYLYRQKHMSGGFENVGWCKPGFESFYNVVMMEELQTILSLGGGGVTKLVNPNTGRILRISNPKYPQDYVEKAPRLVADKEPLLTFQQAFI